MAAVESVETAVRRPVMKISGDSEFGHRID